MTYARRCLEQLLGPAGDEDGLIGQVEDDHAHVIARNMRTYAGRQRGIVRTLTLRFAEDIDPYELRDGQLVRKTDGTPVRL